MKTFNEYIINEGKLQNLAATMLIGLATTGISPVLKAQNPQNIHYNINKGHLTKLYRAIEQAEMSGRKNKWIRTEHQTSKGSSAYGPVQITQGLLEDKVQRYKSFYNKHKTYIDKFLKQSELFLKYGGKDMVKGYEQYDYGQKGDLSSEKYHGPYLKMAFDLMQIVMKESKYDLMTFIEKWRGKTYKEDKRYYDTVIKEFFK